MRFTCIFVNAFASFAILSMNQHMVEANIVQDHLVEADMVQNRIVGGRTVIDPLTYPFYAFSAGSGLCGASLIWKDFLLTAAHCGKDLWADGVLVGGNSIDGQGSKFYPVVESIMHPSYDTRTSSNDIMLLKISGNSPGPFVKLNFNRTIPAARTELTAVGYGRTSERGSISYSLQDVDFQTVAHQECRNYYGSYIADDIMVCNGYADGGKDTCQGDSGGPVFVKGTDVQIGVVSFGHGCARNNTPAVNTRVSAYAEWIQSTLCKSSAYPPESCKTMMAKTTKSPTKAPTKPPTKAPTKKPTKAPTKAPVTVPKPVAAVAAKLPNLVSTPMCLASSKVCTYAYQCCSKKCALQKCA